MLRLNRHRPDVGYSLRTFLVSVFGLLRENHTVVAMCCLHTIFVSFSGDSPRCSSAGHPVSLRNHVLWCRFSAWPYPSISFLILSHTHDHSLTQDWPPLNSSLSSPLEKALKSCASFFSPWEEIKPMESRSFQKTSIKQTKQILCHMKRKSGSHFFSLPKAPLEIWMVCVCQAICQTPLILRGI